MGPGEGWGQLRLWVPFLGSKMVFPPTDKILTCLPSEAQGFCQLILSYGPSFCVVSGDAQHKHDFNHAATVHRMSS